MASSVRYTANTQGATRCRPMLGTYVEIRMTGTGSEVAGGADEAIFDAAVDTAVDTAFAAAFAAIAQCETLMSFHDPASELSRINRAGSGEVVDVHPWTAEVLTKAMALFELTDGLFDAGVGAQLVGWGMLPPPSPVYAGGQSSLADIACLSGRIHILRRTCLDLGGIAKGFAVDRAADALCERGVKHAIINAGGDLRVIGNEPHAIHVRHPRSPSTLICLGELADGALATSAPYFSRQRVGDTGTEVCALVDAHRREPLLDARSYTVIAPECWIADALTKVLAAGEPPEAACFSQYGAQAIILEE